MTKSNIIPFPGSRQPGTKQSDTGSIYRLRVELEEIEPVIYRVLLVRGTIGLDLLHAILQVAIGWTNSHLHKFNIGDSEYSDPEFNLNEDAFEGRSSLRMKLLSISMKSPRARVSRSATSTILATRGNTGLLLKISCPDDGTLAGFAECIDGKRACPPEDCGGVPGYADFVGNHNRPGE